MDPSKSRWGGRDAYRGESRAMPEAAHARPDQNDDPEVIWSWAMYDWASSAFTTLVVTFIYSTF